METVADFILGGSKITADGNCSHEIKRHLLKKKQQQKTNKQQQKKTLAPWKKSYDQPR